MKSFQLIHVCHELGARSITVTEEYLKMDRTVPPDEINQALKLDVGEKMLIHYGCNPVKTGNLIREV